MFGMCLSLLECTLVPRRKEKGERKKVINHLESLLNSLLTTHTIETHWSRKYPFTLQLSFNHEQSVVQQSLRNTNNLSYTDDFSNRLMGPMERNTSSSY